MDRARRDEQAATVQELLVQSHVLWHPVLEEAWQRHRQQWVTVLLNRPLAVVGKEDVAYLESRVGDGEDTVVVLAFTDSLVVQLRGAVDDDALEVVARSRRGLKEVTVLTLDDDGRGQFPTAIALQLRYAVGDPIELGARTEHNGDLAGSSRRLAIFHSSLLADLERG